MHQVRVKIAELLGECQVSVDKVGLYFREADQACSNVAMVSGAYNSSRALGNGLLPGQVFYLGLSKVSANQRRCHLCDIFPHWLIPCMIIDRKLDLVWASNDTNFLTNLMIKIMILMITIIQSNPVILRAINSRKSVALEPWTPNFSGVSLSIAHMTDPHVLKWANFSTHAFITGDMTTL